MNNTESKRLAYGITVFNFLLAISFCVVFFYILKDLPESVPLHWSEQGGFDKWGAKSSLYPLNLIPTGIAVLALPSSILLIRRDYKFVSYIINFTSIFLTCIMFLVALFMFKNA